MGGRGKSVVSYVGDCLMIDILGFENETIRAMLQGENSNYACA